MTPESLTANAPRAAKLPTTRSFHGDDFIDNYEWLREKSNPEVIAHLTAENEYTDTITAGQQPLRDALFSEIKGRTVEQDGLDVRLICDGILSPDAPPDLARWEKKKHKYSAAEQAEAERLYLS